MTDKTAARRSDEVRQALEEDIFLGKLRPGSRLDEEGLAQRFNTSRTPVREAILHLVSAGLAEKKPRQGAVVAPLDLIQMVQMFEVMGELEGLCARYAARRMSPEEREALAQLHDRAQEIGQRRDVDAFNEVNRDFHELLHSGSHNAVLAEMARSLFGRLAPYRRYQLGHPSRLAESCEQHGQVVAAILAGDPAAAQAAMRKHVTIQADVFAEFVSVMSR